MFRTRVTETSTLVGLVPAGRPSNANQARRLAAAVTLRVSASWIVCALAALGAGPAQAQAPSETVLFSFGSAPSAAAPYAGVVSDSAGNLYGTTSQGGAANAGVAYKLDAAGQETVLYSFTGGADGDCPYAGVIRDAAGNLYGTTYAGGTSGAGVVYKLDAAGQETVLYSFTGFVDGGYPRGGVIRDSSGNLYGTTYGGGAGKCNYEVVPAYLGQRCGVVFKLDPSGQETVLYTFRGGGDGFGPAAGVIRDSAGNLYGTTANGGLFNPGVCPDSGCGVVFKLDTSGNLTVLHRFAGGIDGSNPRAGVIRYSAGNLYGTTQNGGESGNGAVYKLDAAGNETVLYSFTGGADGSKPWAGVVRDSAGNLYGTTYYGGTADWGVVYKLDAAGQETVLMEFTGGAGGGGPWAGVIRDPAGNLYGTAGSGGTAATGVVFKLTP